MDKIHINFKNCHGIKKLNKDFIFEKDSTKNTNIILIYARNGIMKTSFAKTLKDCGNNVSPKNIISDEKPIWNIKVTENNKKYELEDSKEIKNRIFVIESINDEFSFENTGPLISNKECRKHYEKISKDIISDKNKFLDKIKSITGLSIPKSEDKYSFIENIINKDLNNNDLRFLEFMSINLNNLENIDFNIDVTSIQYDHLFHPSILKLLDDPELVDNINSFSNNLEKLLSESKIYNNKDFNHNHAMKLSKTIEKNNLFKLGHSINFKGVHKNIRSIVALNELFDKQINNIFKNETLKEDFEKINKKFSNNNTRDFQQTILNNQYLIPYLKDISELKKIYWYSVFNSEKEILENLVNKFNDKIDNLEKIRSNALKEQTSWHKIINQFNKRFKVPYTLKIKNQADVILTKEIPKIAYFYGEKEISLDKLKSIYSAGQRRALYLLDILYKIEMMKETNVTKLLIFDDIADSFDYENKYAIIEYIYDLSRIDDFRIILLTHNFDFFRTLKSRLNCKYAYFATKNEYNDISLKENFASNNNIFITIRKKMEEDKKNHIKYIIALIPFMRNLYEYAGKNDKKKSLTNILHYTEEGDSMTLDSLEENYNDWNVSIPNISEKIYKLIYDEADKILNNNKEEVNIINKLILSMAIRLKSEKKMIKKLGDNFNEEDIKGNQTRRLFEKYVKLFSNDNESIDIYERVVMMTPENIHVNSFMYEPILDMDDYHLKELYKDVLEL